jgi:hypothetical protein
LERLPIDPQSIPDGKKNMIVYAAICLADLAEGFRYNLPQVVLQTNNNEHQYALTVGRLDSSTSKFFNVTTSVRVPFIIPDIEIPDVPQGIAWVKNDGKIHKPVRGVGDRVPDHLSDGPERKKYEQAVKLARHLTYSFYGFLGTENEAKARINMEKSGYLLVAKSHNAMYDGGQLWSMELDLNKRQWRIRPSW